MNLYKYLPALAKELETGLYEIGETTLALSVQDLEIVDRCRCGDKGCGTFYTLDKDVWTGRQLTQVVPEVKGLFAVDIYKKQIVCIEILDRNDVERKLNELLPI